MKLLKQLIIGAIVGFFGAFLLLGVSEIDFSIYTDAIVIGLFIIILILWGWSFLLHKQIKNLDSKELKGEEEDEADVLKYKKISDYMLFVQSSSVISLLTLCITITTPLNITLIIISIIFLIVSYFLAVTGVNSMRRIYPERNLPKISDSKYEEKLLEAADEGEKYVIMQGLYKAYNLLNVVLIFAIVGSAIYSMVAESSQVFSIVLMSIVLLLVNGRYLLVIRNK
ncbi:MAG TPA: DUF3169 family protein [Pseudogracilibacillus sp.]|nr:DUF3169 family protein [Pseudogracilibacillus sp.]